MTELYGSVFVKFENADARQKWFIEHVINQSVPKGGPVFSFSQEDESVFRDIASELLAALQKLRDDAGDQMTREGEYISDIVNPAIAKAKGAA